MVCPHGAERQERQGRAGAESPWLWALVALCCTGLLASCTSGNGQPAPANDEFATDYVPPQGASLIGADKCIECHDDEGKALANTLHGKKADPRSPMAKQGCESCHGPGSVHADAGGGKGTILAFGEMASSVNPRTQSTQCLQCHTGMWPDWKQSKHSNRDITCTNCHTVHKSTPRIQHQLKMEQTEVCAQCHKHVKADLAKQSHHPIREGKVLCYDCHNPHGSPYQKNLRTPVPNELCYKCHAEKRGPFLFEHAPVIEDCTTCHQPHGSIHNKLLTAQPPFLCIRCHSNARHPGTPLDANTLFNGQWQPGPGALVPTGPSNRSFAGSCLNCHMQVHGSNHPSGKFFQR